MGAQPLEIEVVPPTTEDFIIDTAAVTSRLAPGDTTKLPVTFSPQSVGEKSRDDQRPPQKARQTWWRPSASKEPRRSSPCNRWSRLPDRPARRRKSARRAARAVRPWGSWDGDAWPCKQRSRASAGSDPAPASSCL